MLSLEKRMNLKSKQIWFCLFKVIDVNKYGGIEGRTQFLEATLRIQNGDLRDAKVEISRFRKSNK